MLELMDDVRQAVRTDEVAGSRMTPAATELLQRGLKRADVTAGQAAHLALRFAEAQKALQRVTFEIFRAVGE